MDTKLQSDEVKLLMHINQELASDLWRLSQFVKANLMEKEHLCT